MKKYISIFSILLFVQSSQGAINCAKKTWSDDLEQAIEKLAKKKVQTLDANVKNEIVGKWYESPKGDKYRLEAMPDLEFFLDGTGKMRSGGTFDYEVLSNKIIYKRRSTGNKLSDEMMDIDKCFAVLKVDGKFYLPSRESLITPLFR